MNYKTTAIITFILILLCGMSVPAMAQKEEIKAFEKDNKALIKQLKKDYGAKVEVQLADNYTFYFVLTKKEKNDKTYWLIDQTGRPLYQGELSWYKYVSGGYFYVMDKQIARYGVVNTQGKLILPVEFNDIKHGAACANGTYTDAGMTMYHPATKEYFLTSKITNGAPTHYTFYSADGTTVLYEYDGNLEPLYSYYWVLSPKQSTPVLNQKGLLAFDGTPIFPRDYQLFTIGKTGFIGCLRMDEDGCWLRGGKMINPENTAVEVPAIFNGVIWDVSGGYAKVNIHRGDEYERYDPTKTYEITYKDKGHKLFDGGKFEKVITYYEGEGYGTPWGYYYMGLAANELAKQEERKMDNCINTLKSSTLYYLPIKSPEKYEFNTGQITTMYLSASRYLEQYINLNDVPDDDPTKVTARKLRGEVVTASNNITKKIEEYGSALSAATTKNIEREARIARQQAEQEAAAQSLANGLTNLLLGGSKKK